MPVDGETLSQETPPALAANVAFGLAVSEIAFEPGDEAPAVAENDSEVGLTVSTGAEMLNCTGTWMVLFSPRRMLIVPLYVPPARPLGLADTVSVWGVVRYPDGETESHVRVPLVPEALTEKCVA